MKLFHILKSMVSRRWIIATILVIAAMGVMIRLGIWQLDRLDGRRAFNARVLAQTSQPILFLDGKPVEGDMTCAGLFDAMPHLLGADSLRSVADMIVKARKQDRQFAEPPDAIHRFVAQ